MDSGASGAFRLTVPVRTGKRPAWDDGPQQALGTQINMTRDVEKGRGRKCAGADPPPLPTGKGPVCQPRNCRGTSPPTGMVESALGSLIPLLKCTALA